jgi:serine/threonine-protein kinase
MMFEPGYEIAGYRIERLLGRGGMGRVYEATQLGLERPVALKILNDDLSGDEAFRARFRREGRVQGALAHPHVVGVHEAGEADSRLFIAMQLVDGPTLKELVLDGAMDPHRATAILAQVADALDAAHAAGLTHRDIKPQNVLVGPGDHAYLADFGLTKTLSDSAGFTRTGQFMGTIDYISPEQINGRPATPASDIYALAAILYESVTGSVPFPRDTEAAVLFAHISSEPPAVSTLRVGLPAALDAIVSAGLAKEPGDRPATATALLEAALEALGGPAGARGTAEPATAAEAGAGDGPQGATPPQVLRRPVTDADFPPTMAPGSRLVPPESDPSLTVPDHLPPELAERADAAAASAAAVSAAQLRRRRRLVGAGGLAVVVVAGVAGVLAGGRGATPEPATAASPLSSTVANGTVAASFPTTWHQRPATPAAHVLGLRSPITIEAARDATVAVGLASSSNRRLLSSTGLKAVEGKLPRPDRVRVGVLSAYRYRGVRLRGVSGTTDVLAAPTTAGIVTLACTLGASAPVGAAADCTRIFGSLRLQKGRPSTLGPDAAYATALGEALLALDQRRVPARRTLAAATGPKSQSGAADDVATAYRRAATALAGATPGPAEEGVHADLRAALSAAARAYARLGTASRGGHRAAYATAATAVREAEHDVGTALKALTAHGYRVD